MSETTEDSKRDEMDQIADYVKAAAVGLSQASIVHNLSADQIADRSWEIGLRLYEYQKNNGHRPAPVAPPHRGR